MATRPARPVFGLVIPEMGKGPWAGIVSGIRQAVQRDGHGVCVPLCWDDAAAVLRHPSVFARLCAEATIPSGLKPLAESWTKLVLPDLQEK